MAFSRARWIALLFAAGILAATALQQRSQADGARAAAWAQVFREGVPAGPYVFEDERGRDAALPGYPSILLQGALPLRLAEDGRIRDREGRAVCHVFSTSVRWLGLNRWEVVAGWSAGGRAGESAAYTLENDRGRWMVTVVANRSVS